MACGEALVDMVPDPVPGGGPMNVAVAAARLGAPAAFVGRISTDHYGEAILAHLHANQVDVRSCERGPEPTARAIVEHQPHLVFRFDGDDSADMHLATADLQQLGAGPHILHGGTLGLFRGRTAETLARLVERHTGVISLDPNVRPQIIDDRERWLHHHDRWVEHAHIYKVSDEDLEWIKPGRSIDSAAEELLGRRTEVMLLTRGGRGVTVYSPDGAVDVDAHPAEVVDTVGAGDTFVGSILASLWDLGITDAQRLAQLDLDQWRAIAARATAAAAITCSRPGADPPRVEEVPSWASPGHEPELTDR